MAKCNSNRLSISPAPCWALIVLYSCTIRILNNKLTTYRHSEYVVCPHGVEVVKKVVGDLTLSDDGCLKIRVCLVSLSEHSRWTNTDKRLRARRGRRCIADSIGRKKERKLVRPFPLFLLFFPLTHALRPLTHQEGPLGGREEFPLASIGGRPAGAALSGACRLQQESGTVLRANRPLRRFRGLGVQRMYAHFRD